MPELCLCGDPACACCFPSSYRQARAWEREQAAQDRMTSAEPPAVRSAAPEPPLPPTAAPVYSDLWDRNGDEARDWAGIDPDEGLPVARGKRRSAL